MDRPPVPHDIWLCGVCWAPNVIQNSPTACPGCGHSRDYGIGCCSNPGEPPPSAKTGSRVTGYETKQEEGKVSQHDRPPPTAPVRTRPPSTSSTQNHAQAHQRAALSDELKNGNLGISSNGYAPAQRSEGDSRPVEPLEKSPTRDQETKPRVSPPRLFKGDMAPQELAQRATQLAPKSEGEEFISVVSGDLQHTPSSSFAKALGAVTSQFTRQKTRRRLSSFASASSAPRRRASLTSFVEPLPTSSSIGSPMTSIDTAATKASQSFMYKRFNSMRRRPASGAPRDLPTLPITYSSQSTQGADASPAAAAANQERHEQERRKQELEHTQRFLNDLSSTAVARDGKLQGNESDTDKTCASDGNGDYYPLPPGRWIIPFRGNCPRCNHYHSTTQIVTLDAQVYRVKCEKCKESWAHFSPSPKNLSVSAGPSDRTCHDSDIDSNSQHHERHLRVAQPTEGVPDLSGTSTNSRLTFLTHK